MKRLFTIGLVLLSLISCKDKNHVSPWKEGYLDIHAVNTGRGESMFYVFPDGTTMLVDCAGSLLKEHTYMPTDPKPDSSVTSAQVISEYIRHFAPKSNRESIDYVMISHYHSDHMGDVNKHSPIAEGGYRLSSTSELGTEIPFKKLITRGDHNKVVTYNCSKESIMKNFLKFVDWTKEKNGTVYEYFEPGRDDQIVPLKKEVPSFKIQNIAAAGYYWTGDSVVTDIPPREELEAAGLPLPPENNMSCVFVLSYGDFNMFSGGDLQYSKRDLYPYYDLETPVSKVVSKVEVMKASHHGTSNTNCQELLDVLRPDVFVVNNWRDIQPNPETIGRLYKASPDCDVYLTNLAERNREPLGEYLDRFKSLGGHIVIRVAPGGKSYLVYTLDDSDFDYRITGSFGPYECN
jgi:beta-lactamase superfamily II metal-dependent hydrolase